MKIFISHAQPRGRELAEALGVFIRRVVQGVDPWVSKTSIDKGTRWSEEIRANLIESAAGITCITPESLKARWLLFESGALATKEANRLWTFLLDIDSPNQVEKPLGDFQPTIAEKADTLEMVKSIHGLAVRLNEKSTNLDDLEPQFEMHWESLLGPTIKKLKEQGKPADSPALKQRGVEEILEDVLSEVRALSKFGSTDSWRTEKTLKLLQLLYRLQVGPLPSMEQLRNLEKSPEILEDQHWVINPGLLWGTSFRPGAKWRDALGGRVKPGPESEEGSNDKKTE